MSWIGCILMFSGWLIAISALLLLVGTGQRVIFVIAGILIELLGLALVAYSYRTIQKGHA